MAPSQFQSRQGDDRSGHAPQRHVGVSESTVSQRRNDASQPSSSSLSSIGDEIITTGLRVGPSSYPPRRRRLQQRQRAPTSNLAGQTVAQAQAGASSQEEYDESESEEDRVMTSSNEHHHRPTASLQHQQTAFRSNDESHSDDDDDDDDDDENATALGRPSNSPTFRPQPNAFSHPPNHHAYRHPANPPTPQHPPFPRPSMSHRSQPRAHRNFMSPSYQADNDAALRASLTTLLSCAAAARGLPKRDNGHAGPSGTGGIGAGIMPGSQPMELRLVPESELMAQGPSSGSPIPAHLRQQSRSASASNSPSAPSSNSSKTRDAAEKGKRPSAPQIKSPRAAKKKRTAAASDVDTTTFISPTILTWVVSAGVVVLVSVVGFGAGYVIGREVGRQEGVLGVGMGSTDGAAAAANASSCGRELAKSTSGGTLRRFRWGAVAKGVTA